MLQKHTQFIYKRTQQARTVIQTRKLTIHIGTVLLKAKKQFARVSSGRTISEDDFKGKSCMLIFFHTPRAYQTLAYMIAIKAVISW